MSEAATKKERIGFVGVGRMGSVMLQCVLEAGYSAVLCDPNPEAIAAFVEKFPQQVRVAATPREAAEQTDIIEVVVNTNEQLLECCLGQTGILAGARASSIVLIHSTVARENLERLGKAAAERSVFLLDAMVSGARGHLSIPNLAVMVGGDAAAFARAKPVMDTFGSLVLHLGKQGAGLDAKLAINMLRYVVMATSQEVARMAEKAGVGDAMAQLVAHTESNRYVGNLTRVLQVPAAYRKKDAELAQKDLRAAIARAAELGVQLPTAELAVGLMHRLWSVDHDG